MNINTILFMPQLNTNSINAGHYIGGFTQHQQHLSTSNMNAAATIFQMRPMPIIQQPHTFMGHQQQQQHSQSPAQRQGHTYYPPNSNRYFYNSTMALRTTAPATLGATNQNGGGARINYRKLQNNNFTAQTDKTSKSNEMDNRMNTTEKTIKTSIAMPSKEPQQQTSSTASSKITAELPTNTQNATAVKNLSSQARPQHQQQRKSYNYNYNNNNNKQYTKRSNLKRSDSTTSQITIVTATTKLLATATAPTKVANNNRYIKMRQQQRKQNDTMQRKSSKASHSASASASSKKATTSTSTSTTTKSQNNNKNHDSSDSGISSHNGQRQNQNTATSVKQRKARGGNKRQEAAAVVASAATATNASASSNATNSAKPSGAQQKRADTTSGFIVNEWLQNDVYCYESQFISSCVEDKRMARHNPAHRNSTSSEATGSDDLNSEDRCPSYTIQSKTAKKSTKSRQKRQQQKRKQQHSTSSSATPLPATTKNPNVTNTNTTTPTHQQPMDIDEEYKENRKPQHNVGSGHKQQSSSTAALNLRKQCTKTAALKASQNNEKSSKSLMRNVLTTSPSNSSVCSTLSSSSSSSISISSSLSSSASSSPEHSLSSSPTASPTITKRSVAHFRKVVQALTPPLRQFIKLNWCEHHIVEKLKEYVVAPAELAVYGFPVESERYPGCIEIYKCLPKHLAHEAVTRDYRNHHILKYGYMQSVQDSTKTKGTKRYVGLPSSAQWTSYAARDSGNGSDDSTPPFTDSDSSEMVEDHVIKIEDKSIMTFNTPDGVIQKFYDYNDTEEKKCVRCTKTFRVNGRGEYQTLEECRYHWGKPDPSYTGKKSNYHCCKDEEASEGCSHHPLHVWNGCVVGANGPYRDFVHTRPRTERKKRKHPKLYAVDCEMSYTGLGLEVTKVTVVGYDGALVYEHFVKPLAPIVDYNTRFSGITENDLSPHSNNSVKTFAQMQKDLLRLFDADTILIGHGLDNDLRALRLVHKNVVDTSLVFSHSTGYPYRRSLKVLTLSYLEREIQCSEKGHSSFEDSRACLELMMYRLRTDKGCAWTACQ